MGRIASPQNPIPPKPAMQFKNVCLESFGYCLPEERITTGELELQLAPLYERLRLPEGRLELITGIAERRFWQPNTLPSDRSIDSAGYAIQAADFDPTQVGALIHASVCRDHLEPATACRVHHALGLRSDCLIYDVSNACLGLMNGALQIAQMIELGQIKAGIVVGTESSRQLVETTISELNTNETLTRSTIKSAIASLTIGSGSCAMLLTHADVSRSGSRLTTAAVRAETKHHQLCHSGADEAVASGMQPMMETDSETLMREGVAAGVATFDDFLSKTSWQRDEQLKTVCHQVGTAHRRMMLGELYLPVERDFATVTWLGNTGSVALPVSTAYAVENDHFSTGDHVGLLGIGSGINCLMMGVEWQSAFVAGEDPNPAPFELTAVASSARV